MHRISVSTDEDSGHDFGVERIYDAVPIEVSRHRRRHDSHHKRFACARAQIVRKVASLDEVSDDTPQGHAGNYAAIDLTAAVPHGHGLHRVGPDGVLKRDAPVEKVAVAT